ncbi:MAG: hypothetical protein L0G99_09205 [Propionibacteriales bacterium]|nr:hypothetical protein [Propionibacteriales bacterium]
MGNTSLSGGFVAYVVGAMAPVEASATQTGRVFIHGRECRALEARCGGVAVQPVGTQGRGPRT